METIETIETIERIVGEEFNKIMYRLGLRPSGEARGPVFYSELGFINAKNYIKGLLSPIERKNGWQMSEHVGERTPYKMQQFIYRGQYSAGEVRDVLRGYVCDSLGEEDGVLVVDDTGFIKKGKKSCGVKRQYSGTAGKIENLSDPEWIESL